MWPVRLKRLAGAYAVKLGDDVVGTVRGAFTDYACTSESALVMKPDDVTFAQAASLQFRPK
ncbi:MAG TPA: hypothetical protein VEV41_11290 [Terriglobales bacterium]|jgi:NADPH:quinone reductase-like Zn-dependent oxidoreductase|nr:hypothetical protein [Terriglobales bacterium]